MVRFACEQNECQFKNEGEQGGTGSTGGRKG